MASFRITLKAFMRILITGSSGLIGSEAVAYFSERDHRVWGVDNNSRQDYFGPGGNTTPNLRRLQAQYPGFVHASLDIRDRPAMATLVQKVRPEVVIHSAAQPSHDVAALRPFDDFDVNAVGTLNILEACRRHAPEVVFIFTSTNKVYGDAPNEIPLVEMPTRWDYARPEDSEGLSESCRIDQTLHTAFGASKLAADILVQEYGRHYGLQTGVFRGGCLTGPRQAGTERHGFLSYIFRAAAMGRRYTIYGYKGKQVRDQLHSHDVCRAFEEFVRAPRAGEVYNLGGGRENSLSILETLPLIEKHLKLRLETDYVDTPRRGDHICYISNLRKFRTHYPAWTVAVSVDEICRQIAESLRPTDHVVPRPTIPTQSLG
jgi:CDP-paratose 2-epimerase